MFSEREKRIVEILVEFGRPVSAAEIVKMIDITREKVYGYLKSLELRGFVATIQNVTPTLYVINKRTLLSEIEEVIRVLRKNIEEMKRRISELEGIKEKIKKYPDMKQQVVKKPIREVIVRVVEADSEVIEILDQLKKERKIEGYVVKMAAFEKRGER